MIAVRNPGGVNKCRMHRNERSGKRSFNCSGRGTCRRTPGAAEKRAVLWGEDCAAAKARHSFCDAYGASKLAPQQETNRGFADGWPLWPPTHRAKNARWMGHSFISRGFHLPWVSSLVGFISCGFHLLWVSSPVGWKLRCWIDTRHLAEWVLMCGTGVPHDSRSPTPRNKDRFLGTPVWRPALLLLAATELEVMVWNLQGLKDGRAGKRPGPARATAGGATGSCLQRS